MKLLKMMGIAAGVIAVFIIGFIAWFFIAMAQYTDTEIGRFPSPNGSIEAVVVKRSGNATVGFIELVHIVPRGAKPKGDPSFLADHVSGLDVQWPSDDRLLIRAKNARIYKNDYYYIRDGEKIAEIEYEISHIGRLKE